MLTSTPHRLAAANRRCSPYCQSAPACHHKHSVDIRSSSPAGARQMIGCKGQSNARHSVIQSRRVAKVAASANSPFDLPSDKVQSEAYPKREPDVLLCVADGKEVPAYSEVLYLASDALRELLSQAWEELHAGMDYGPFCPASVLHLPLPDDSAAGWVHVLDLISPDRPDLPLDKLNLVAAQQALPIAHQYGMTRPITRYERHLESVLLPKLSLQDSVEWLDLLSRVGKQDGAAVDGLVNRCSQLVRINEQYNAISALTNVFRDKMLKGKPLQAAAATRLLGVLLSAATSGSRTVTCTACGIGFVIRQTRGGGTFFQCACPQCGKAMFTGSPWP